jgi:cytochrome c
MRIIQRNILILIAISFMSTTLFAQTDANKAVTLVKSAVKYFKANGKDKCLDAITKGRFKQGEIYVFCYNLEGVMLAHPENKALIGKNLINVPDVEGKLFRKEIIENAKSKGSGWSDYKYKNPVLKKIESKTTYFEKAGDIVFCCGIYKK